MRSLTTTAAFVSLLLAGSAVPAPAQTSVLHLSCDDSNDPNRASGAPTLTFNVTIDFNTGTAVRYFPATGRTLTSSTQPVQAGTAITWQEHLKTADQDVTYDFTYSPDSGQLQMENSQESSEDDYSCVSK